MKNKIKIFAIFAILIIAKLWVGINTHDEFGGKNLFIKHRPIWRTFFYSPRGMSDMKVFEMSEEQQKDQSLYDEFILKNQVVE